MKNCQLILVSQNRLSREGLTRVLSSSGLKVIGDVASAAEAVPLLEPSDSGVTVVIYDQANRGPQQFRELQGLIQRFPQIVTVILADEVTLAGLAAAVAAGARGFLPKDISAHALSLSIQLIALGEDIFAAPAELLRNRQATAVTPQPHIDYRASAHFSDRESQVLASLCVGMSNRAIAHELNLSEATVKIYIKAVLRKIGAENRTQAAIWAMNHQEIA